MRITMLSSSAGEKGRQTVGAAFLVQVCRGPHALRAAARQGRAKPSWMSRLDECGREREMSARDWHGNISITHGACQ